MKEIKLTQGKVALVDDEDFEYLNQFKWHAKKGCNTFYAKRSIKGSTLSMHSLIMKPPHGFEIDHKDLNGLNNQKDNLRICTRSQNQANRKKAKGNSRYLGVCRLKGEIYNGKKYRDTIIATINKDNKLIYLGSFKTEEEAAIAYDIAAKKLHGEFAYLNFK
jgi:hypothetical protein